MKFADFSYLNGILLDFFNKSTFKLQINLSHQIWKVCHTRYGRLETLREAVTSDIKIKIYFELARH